ncbi:MAG: hypothetical protein K0S28_1716 [Paucimonas sp.]|jgi:diguanylate cyclase (GGDEF)-like protein|nr:hypothetical protein [Paucimonas sp.]
MSFKIFEQTPLSSEAERQLHSQHEADLSELLPRLGPLLGIGLVLFSFWDYIIDAQSAPLTLYIRIAFVIAGTLAYFPNRLNLSPTQRCIYLYWTFASAIIICEFILQGGIVQGLTGISGCIFMVSVMTLRDRTFAAAVSLPTIMFAVLAFMRLSPLEFANGMMLYLFCAGLAYVLMRVIRFFRMKAFRLQLELTKVSRHDSLTGAYRRGYLTELAEHEIAAARRYHRPLAIAMLDIDRFKRVNDTYGHDIGDHVIRHLAVMCMESQREVDHFGRIGGEEFVWILPQTDEADAMTCAERLRRKIEDSEVKTAKGPVHFTVSIGVAALDNRHGSWSELLKDADTALYRAKNEGRNRVIAASSNPLPQAG